MNLTGLLGNDCAQAQPDSKVHPIINTIRFNFCISASFQGFLMEKA